MPWEGKNLPFTKGNVVSYWFDSQLHRRNHSILTQYLLRRQILELEPVVDVSVVSPHSQCATTLNFDNVENRFLLSGGKQGSIAIHDLERMGDGDRNSLQSSSTVALEPRKIKSLHSAPLFPGNFHSISTVQWYPADSGLFLAASFGGRFSLFDTNSFVPVFALRFSNQKVMCAKFHNNPGNSTLHSCIALGLSQGETLLLDPRIGDRPIARMQTHNSAINSVDWHTSSGHFDYQLLTAGDDGAVRMWDIRNLAAASSTQRIPLLSLDWTNDHTFHLPHSDYASQNLLHSLLNNSSSNIVSAPILAAHRVGQPQNRVASHAASVTAHAGASVKQARFTPCGRHILSAGNDGSLRLWSSQTGQYLPTRYEVGHRSQGWFPLEFYSMHDTDELLCVLPSTHQQQLQHQQHGHSRSTPLSQQQQSPDNDGSTVAVCPVYGASGRAVTYLRNGHLRGPVSGIAVAPRRYQCGNRGAIVTCASDGLILLWQRPIRTLPEEEEEEEGNEITGKRNRLQYRNNYQMLFSTTAHELHVPRSEQTRTRDNHRIESRYDFERDILHRHFSSSMQSNDNNNRSSNSGRAFTVVVNPNSVPVSTNIHSVNRTDNGSNQLVQVRELETATQRVFPTVLRSYLQQARFHSRFPASTITAAAGVLEGSEEKEMGVHGPSIDWKAVEAILQSHEMLDAVPNYPSYDRPNQDEIVEDRDLFGGVSSGSDEDEDEQMQHVAEDIDRYKPVTRGSRKEALVQVESMMDASRCDTPSSLTDLPLQHVNNAASNRNDTYSNDRLATEDVHTSRKRKNAQSDQLKQQQDKDAKKRMQRLRRK